MAGEGDRQSQPGALRQVGALAGAGVQFAAIVSLCVAAGWWLDEKLGTSPWLLLVGGLLGAVAAFYHLYRLLLNVSAADDKDRDKDREG